jgi:hypothetical protein
MTKRSNKEAGMFDPSDLENYESYCDRILEQISREELLQKARRTKPGIRTQLFTTAGDVMIQIGSYLKAKATPEQSAHTPSIYIQT